MGALPSDYLRAMRLTKQLEKKARETARSRLSAEKEISIVEGIIENAKKADVNVAEAEVLLTKSTEAMVDRDYMTAFEYAVSSKKKVEKIFFERASEILKSSRALFELTKKLKIDVGKQEELLKSAEAAVHSKNYVEAIALSKQSWEGCEKILYEHLSGTFSSAQSLIHFAKNRGEDVSAAEDLLSRARSAVEASEYEDALNYTKDCLDSIGSGIKKEIEGIIDEVNSTTRIAGEIGLSTSKIDELKGSIDSELERYDYERALNVAKKTKDEANKIIKKWVEDAIGSCESTFKEAEEINAEISKARSIFEKAKKAFENEEFEKAVGFIKNVKEDVKNAQFQRVFDVIDSSHPSFLAAKKAGMDISKTIGLLAKARKALKEEDYAQSLSLANKAEEMIKIDLEGYAKAEEEVKNLREYIANADDFGIDIASAQETIKKANIALQKNEFDNVFALCKKCKGEVDNAWGKKAVNMIGASSSLLPLAEKLNVDITDLNALIDKATTAVKAKDYENSIRFAEECREDIGNRISESIAELISTTQSTIDSAEEINIDEAKESLHQANSFLIEKNYEKAYKYITKGKKAIEKNARELAENSLKSLEKNIDIARERGTDVSPLEEQIKNAVDAMKQENYIDVLALTAQAQVDAKKITIKFVEEALSSSISDVADIKNLGIDISNLKEILKKAKTALAFANYDEVFELINKSNEEVERIKELKNKAYDSITSSAELIAEARKKGMDVAEVMETFHAAKSAYGLGEFNKSLTLSEKNRIETDKLIEEHDATTKIVSLQEKIELAEGLGREIPKIKEIFDSAKQALDAGSYKDSLRIADERDSEIAQMLQKEISNIISSSSSMVKEAEKRGIDVSSQKELLRSAKSSLADDEFKRSIETALLIQKEVRHLRNLNEQASDLIKKAEEELEAAKALEIYVPKAENLLHDAKYAFEEYDYEESIQFTSKSLGWMLKTEKGHAVKSIAFFRKSMSKAQRKSIKCREAENLMEQADEALKSAKYKEALDLSRKGIAEIEKVMLQYEMTVEAIKNAEKKIKEAERDAFDVEKARELLKEAVIALKNGVLVKALEFAIQSGDELYRVEEFAEGMEKEIDVIDRNIELASSMGMDLKKIKRSSDKVRALMGKHRYKKAQRIVRMGRDEVDEAIRSHLKDEVDGIATNLTLANNIGISISKINKRFSTGKRFQEQNRFEKAYELFQGCEEELNELLKKYAEEKNRSSKAKIAAIKNMGVDVIEFEEMLGRTDELLHDEDYDEALNSMKQAEEGAELKRKKHREFLDTRYVAVSSIYSAKRFGVNVKKAQELLEKAQRFGNEDYDKALVYIKQSVEEAENALMDYAPKIDVKLHLGKVKKDEWCDAELAIHNIGKALAKNIEIDASGDIEIKNGKGIEKLIGGRVKTIPIQLKPLAKGKIPITLKITYGSMFYTRKYEYALKEEIEVE